jgi:hypothetical protein
VRGNPRVFPSGNVEGTLSLSEKKYYKKGFKMDFKRNRNLLNQAMNAGCKTVAELALFLKAHPLVRL